jgi:D-cysteine desulfhydrase
MLLPQPNSQVVRNNLLLGAHVGADIHEYPGVKSVAAATAALVAKRKVQTGRAPMVIPAGGSSPLGTGGFVNAAFELRNQIDAGDLPEPDVIFLPLGSMGTTAGLWLGLRMVGITTRIEAVRVVDTSFASKAKGAQLAARTLALLRKAAPAIPELDIAPDDFPLRDGYFGERYGLYTPESAEAIRLVNEHAGIKLEGTYGGKAFAALADDAKSGGLKGKTVLFWNTYNSWDFADEIRGVDYKALPRAFHKYFEQAVQPLAQSAH